MHELKENHYVLETRRSEQPPNKGDSLESQRWTNTWRRAKVSVDEHHRYQGEHDRHKI